MKRSASTLLMALSMPLMFTACATIGPPQPPSLDLPKPPSDLRAVRKGYRVILTWTAPTVTTDRQSVRSVGPTRICRGLEPELTHCGTPVGEAPAQPMAAKAQSSAQKPEIVHRLARRYLQSDNPSSFVTYAIEVLNAGGRSAGLSNQVRISLVRTFPPPRDFAARVTGQGVVLTWTNDVPPASSAAVHYVYRVYRRLEGSADQILAGQLPAGSDRVLL